MTSLMRSRRRSWPYREDRRRHQHRYRQVLEPGSHRRPVHAGRPGLQADGCAQLKQLANKEGEKSMQLKLKKKEPAAAAPRSRPAAVVQQHQLFPRPAVWRDQADSEGCRRSEHRQGGTRQVSTPFFSLFWGGAYELLEPPRVLIQKRGRYHAAQA